MKTGFFTVTFKSHDRDSNGRMREPEKVLTHAERYANREAAEFNRRYLERRPFIWDVKIEEEQTR